MSDNYRKTAVIDFDGTLATYDGWKGSDHYGNPILYARDALLELKCWGWRIVVYTTRSNTDGLRAWLELYDMPYDAINSNEHNPPDTSSKPIAEVYFDDRDAHCIGNKPYNWHRAMKRVRKLYQPPLDTYIDDAACWSGWLTRFRNWLKY